MRETTSIPEIIDELARDPLRHIPLLKHLLAYPAHATARRICESTGTATLVALDAPAVPHDRLAYPNAAIAAFLVSDDVELTASLVAAMPRGVGISFKLWRDEDLAPIAVQFPVERRNGLVSFTSAGHFAPVSGVELTSTPSDAVYRMFEAQGHSRTFLEPLLREGKAFACLVEQGREPLSACFAYENYGAVWEVGGVVVAPPHRRKGLGARVARTALAELTKRGLRPRYQVEETNGASIALARSIDLTPFLTITHYARAC
jgi:GNAT superfamily N-acetyltransferase